MAAPCAAGIDRDAVGEAGSLDRIKIGRGVVGPEQEVDQIVMLRARATTGQRSAARPSRTAQTSLCKATVGQMWRGMPYTTSPTL